MHGHSLPSKISEIDAHLILENTVVYILLNKGENMDPLTPMLMTKIDFFQTNVNVFLFYIQSYQKMSSWPHQYVKLLWFMCGCLLLMCGKYYFRVNLNPS
jgi:hypothetical protein